MVIQDYWVVKTDAMGTIEWQNSIGGSIGDLFSSAITNFKWRIFIRRHLLF